ncbi:glycoside hydrolase family 172 protein [Paenibacillaceae bacterium WGS1546]|uniref:glycoside hydrolase family 172 protein n=1 Tax=Cohnella sp. WGS1546 TaxID=3366810 RepID=UPI00372D5817
MRNVIIRIYWDGQQHPSVEVPLGDFFGVAHGRQRHLITECVGMQEGRGFNCWIPMPFKEEARITVENDSGSDIPLFFYQIDFTVGDELDNIGYFHAQFRRSNPPLKEDYVILDGVQGRGVYLGTVIGIRNLYPYLEEWWGEGEVKFYLDGDREYPTICGTGTEDYIGSAWGTGEVCTPYQGAPLIDDEKGLYSLYRFHVKDPIYFQSDLKVTIQQIGAGSREKAVSAYGSLASTYRAVGTEQGSDLCLFERSDDYCSVAYWYQTLPTVPFPQLPDRRQRTEGLLE